MPKSEDALDQRRPRQKLGKAEKAAYARKMFEEDLLRPPKNPIKPLVLPKKPPHRMKEQDDLDDEPPQPAAPPAPPPMPAPPSPATDTFLRNPLYNPWHDLIRRMLEIP
jgi:hypothetical protein